MSFGATTILAIVTIFQQGSVFISTQIPNTPSKFLSTNPYNFHSSSHIVHMLSPLYCYLFEPWRAQLCNHAVFFSLDLIFRRSFFPPNSCLGCHCLAVWIPFFVQNLFYQS